MKLLKDLLADSYSGDYTKVNSVICKYLKKLGANIIKQNNNIIGIFGKPEFLICVHSDTVKPSGKWDTDPLKLKIKDGKAYGLGTCDNKGNIYCVLKAIESAKPKNLMVVFTADEEIAAFGAQKFVSSKYIKGIKHAIVCEPTELKFVNKHKSYSSYTLTAYSKPGHSSDLSKDNCIVTLSKAAIFLNKKGLNVGVIEGGTQENVIPAKCELKVSYRSYGKSFTFPKSVEVVQNHFHECFVNKEGIPFIKEAYHEVSFWTEAALFQKAGISTLVFGAGSIKQAHSTNEYIELSQIDKGIKKLEQVLKHVN